MRFHEDLAGQGSQLVRDLVVYDTGVIAGQAVSVIAGAFQMAVQDPAAAGLADIVGVTQEAANSTATVVTTGALKWAKVQINPLAIYQVRYDLTTSADVSVSSSTSTAVTLSTTDDNCDGGWMYVNSGTGRGQLGYIGAASTTVMTLDTTDAWTTTLDSTSDIILIRPPFALNKDLDSTWALALTDEDETGEALVLENYIQSDSIAMGALVPRQHHMAQNLHNQGVKLYCDLHFCDNVFFGATTMP